MCQWEQVIEAMRQNGGYATFNQLNHLVDVSEWKSKTPEASIRRIVQERNEFFRIQPGLWALEEARDSVLTKFQLKNPESLEATAFTHAYYQGLLVEIGNFKNLDTCVPAQDKNRKYLMTPLREICSLEKIYNFSYRKIMKQAKTVDVVWFNSRKLPCAFFEVEHSTDFRRSLSKFYELQDFYARFFIVAARERERLFQSVISESIYTEIRKRVEFLDYEALTKQYTNQHALSKIGTLL
ncbi:MAG: hypothetical protein Q4C70_13215 [Planctomycetia bacterium]|nr:hypothetical protein [Planctomycetia bacterium]